MTKNHSGKQPKKTYSAHRFLHFYRNRIMNLLVVAVLLLYFIYSVSHTVPEEINRCYELLSVNLKQAQRYEEYAAEANALYSNVQDQISLSTAHTYVTYTEYGTDLPTIVEWLNEDLDDYVSTYYEYKGGKLLSSDEKPALTLTADEKNQLFTDGTFQRENDSNRYYSIAKDDGYMIICINEAEAKQFSMDMLSLVSLNGFIFNNETLDIVEADEQTIPSDLNSMYVSEPIENNYFTDTGIQIRMISPNTAGISKYLNMKLAAVQAFSYQNNGYSIVAYIPASEIVSSILMKSGLPTLLCLAFIFLSIYGSLHFRKIFLKDIDKADQHSQIIRLPFNCFTHRVLARHILFMQLFMGIIIIFCSLILLSINRYEINYENSKYYLEQLTETEEICEKALDDCWNVYVDNAVITANMVKGTLQHASNYTEDELDKFFNSLLETTQVREISIYDKNGECEFTTSAGVGYPLSTNPDSIEYQFRKLMNEDKEKDSILTEPDSDSGLYYYAMRRADEIGVVVMAFTDQGFSELKKKLSKDSVCANFYYCSNCFFADRTEEQSGNSSVYQIASDGSRIIYDSIEFPELIKGQFDCGFRSFNGNRYFVVGLGDTDRSVLYFASVSDILDGFFVNLIVYIVFLIIVCLFDFIGCAVYTQETLEKEDEIDHTEEKRLKTHHLINLISKRVALKDIISDSQKTIWRHGLYSTICLIIFTFAADAFLNRASLFSFLFNGTWENGFHIFAFTVIILTALAAYLFFRILNYLFDEIIINFPPAYAAPVQMIQSILKIAVIAGIIIFSANKLGIDTATILTSVGITGLALGIAAKDTINDMLNGIFIILDGRIRVGDYVEINGFYGQIKKIGIRTTRIGRYNTEKSINNADMKNILNYSRGPSSVYLQFKVAPDTNLEFLGKLIHDASPLFNKACANGLGSDMFFLGATGFDYQGINCSCFALTEESHRKGYTRKCYLVLINLLQDNNISFGYEVYKKIE